MQLASRSHLHNSTFYFHLYPLCFRRPWNLFYPTRVHVTDVLCGHGILLFPSGDAPRYFLCKHWSLRRYCHRDRPRHDFSCSKYEWKIERLDNRTVLETRIFTIINNISLYHAKADNRNFWIYIPVHKLWNVYEKLIKFQ